MVLEAGKHDTVILEFSSLKRDVFGEGYTVMESFAMNMPAFIPASCSTAPDQNDTVTHRSPADLFRFALNAFDGKEAL